jgi:hypothetical protein
MESYICVILRFLHKTKRTIILIFCITVLLFIKASPVDGQATIRGKITDETGEALIGATISVKSPSVTGIVTDLDGNYSLVLSTPGLQVITISFIGFQPISDSVFVRSGEVAVRNYGMTLASTLIGEVTVAARATKGKESYMEQVKIHSNTFLDFISNETIKRTGDSNVSSAVSRITGVSTFSGFITVRGIGDRYIRTTINGLRIPTLDPFTNNIKLDLFPASLIDNIVVNKTANAELPGDWAGAYLSIETKDYPENLAINIESSFGFNTQSTFKKIISSEKSSTDWLGFDSNVRNIGHETPLYYDPATFDYLNQYQLFAALGLKDYFDAIGVSNPNQWMSQNIYKNIYTRLALMELGFLDKAELYDDGAYSRAVRDFNEGDLKQEAIGLVAEDVVKMGQSLPERWLPSSRTAPMEFSQSFSIGNQTTLFSRPLGYIFGFRYNSSSSYDDNTFFGRSDAATTFQFDLHDPHSAYNTFSSIGKNSVETNGWSALVNIASKINSNNSISFMFMPNIVGVNKVRFDDTFSDVTGSPLTFFSIAQHYESRRQMVYELKTDHYIPSLRMKIEFNSSITNARSNIPDFRHLSYVVNDDDEPVSLHWMRNENFRLFSDLTEDMFDSNLSAEIPLSAVTSLPRIIRFGGAWQWLLRRDGQRYYELWGSPTYKVRIPDGNLEEYLALENFGLSGEEINLYYSQDASSLNSTIGFSKIMAGFAMADYSFSEALRVSGGLRVQKVHLHTDIKYYYEKQYSVSDDRRRGVLPAIRDDWFKLPSLSILYRLKPDIAAPVNLRLNYSKTIGLPSLRELTPFRVYDFVQIGYVTGKAGLEPVKIDNFDFRLEAYRPSGNNYSISLFYKNFIDHIEMIREVQSDVYYSWQNTDKSRVIGVEFEGRIGIGPNFEFRANTTIVDSETRLVGDSISRSMFGQAPYIINALLSYNSDRTGTEASVSYNFQGPKLVIKNSIQKADIYEMPRHLIDIRISKKIGDHFRISLKIRDLLNNPNRRAYKFSGDYLDFDRYRFGSTYSIGISYNLN